jgi:[protein-PII] uridylyltransferase
VLDIFRVCDDQARAVAEEPERETVATFLGEALENEKFDFGPLLEKARNQIRQRPGHQVEFPSHIAIDNKAHPIYTLIQLQTPDRLGLLYDLLSCLGREGVSLVLSRISTQNGAAIDTFYVTDSAAGNKITDSNRIAALQKILHSVALGEA